MPHRLSHRRLLDDEIRASIRKHGHKISKKHRIPIKRLEQAQIDLLGNIGFDPVYGARPLKRAIQQQLENPLAREILEGKFQPGDTVAVDAHSGHLVFARSTG